MQVDESAESFWDDSTIVRGKSSGLPAPPRLASEVVIQVPHKRSDDVSEIDLPEWSVIELQGALMPARGSETSFRADEIVDISGKLVGRVAMEERRGKQTPIMYIGSHILDGRTVKLDPPILITEKIEASASDTDGVAARYEVVGVAREKFLFKNRPRFNLG